MEKFDNIKFKAYKEYQSFNMSFARSNNYNVDLSDPDKCLFKLGNHEFLILPVATSTDPFFYDGQSSVHVFGENHPTGFSFPKLNKIIRELGVETDYYNVVDSTTNVQNNKSYETAFKLTALVCDSINGKAFFNISKNQGSFVWFVILKGRDKFTTKFLSVVEKNKLSITNEDADKWYKSMRFD